MQPLHHPGHYAHLPPYWLALRNVITPGSNPPVNSNTHPAQPLHNTPVLQGLNVRRMGPHF